MNKETHPHSPVTSAISRRSALKGLGVAGTLGILNSAALAAPTKSPGVRLKKGSVIVFQGDSITDAGRNKDITELNHEKSFGKGYVGMLAGSLLAKYPDLDLKIYNRGISGNKVPDLAKRWKEDTIALKPDVLSILIGVNDLWHQLGEKASYRATIDDYENGYRDLLQWTRRELPGVQLVIGEAFTTRDGPDFAPLKEYAAVCRKLAVEFECPFVPYDEVIEARRERLHKDFWLWDGIHPTVPGHALMADLWREATGI